MKIILGIALSVMLLGCDAKYAVDYAKKKYETAVAEGKAYTDSTEYKCYAWTDTTCSVANGIGDSLTFRYNVVKKKGCPAVISGPTRLDPNELRKRGMLVE
jgi:hypothetical protein